VLSLKQGTGRGDTLPVTALPDVAPHSRGGSAFDYAPASRQPSETGDSGTAATPSPHSRGEQATAR
jgi:hypothetical protein